jgi:hypothetical protein
MLSLGSGNSFRDWSRANQWNPDGPNSAGVCLENGFCVAPYIDRCHVEAIRIIVAVFGLSLRSHDSENVSDSMRLNSDAGSNETNESELHLAKQYEQRISTLHGITIDRRIENPKVPNSIRVNLESRLNKTKCMQFGDSHFVILWTTDRSSSRTCR